MDCVFHFDISFPSKSSNPCTEHLASDIKEIYASVRHNLVEQQKVAASYYDLNRTPVILEVEDTVLLASPATKNDTCKKWTRFYHGPYKILEQTGPDNFRSTYTRPEHNTPVVVSAADLKKFHHRKEMKFDTDTSDCEIGANLKELKRNQTFFKRTALLSPLMKLGDGNRGHHI